MNVVYDQGLCSLLVNKSIAKLMFDCREDADALYHLHNVRLDGVLDIQLLEVMRRRNKEKLRSMKHCLEKQVSDDNTLLKPKLKGMHSMYMSMSCDIWGKRPLDKQCVIIQVLMF